MLLAFVITGVELSACRAFRRLSQLTCRTCRRYFVIFIGTASVLAAGIIVTTLFGITVEVGKAPVTVMDAIPSVTPPACRLKMGTDRCCNKVLSICS
eukprot:COSAG01_NODE_345_length_18538_cov_64.139433_15_plen_97_part_00